jgi:hypothetical protein
MSRWRRARFDDNSEDPQAALVNLVDIMLVFICGLVVALISAQRRFSTEASDGRQQVEQGRELTQLPEGLRGQQAGEGMQPIGQVYKDPKTGRLILVGQ